MRRAYEASPSTVLQAVLHECHADDPRTPAEETEWKKFSAWLLEVVLDRKRPLRSLCGVCLELVIFRPRGWEHCAGLADHLVELAAMQRD